MSAIEWLSSHADLNLLMRKRSTLGLVFEGFLGSFPHAGTSVDFGDLL